MRALAVFALALGSVVSCGSSDAPQGPGVTPNGGTPGGATGSLTKCTIAVPADTTGGCSFALNEPAAGQQISLPFTFGVSANGCERPFMIAIYGSPLSATNVVSPTFSSYPPNTPNASTIVINPGDLAGVTSDTGLYAWGVSSFYGAHSIGQIFSLAPATCSP